MAVLGSVVQPAVLPMLNPRHHSPFSRGIAGQFIGDHHTRSHALFLEQLAQQALGCFRITAPLNQNVEHEPVLIDSALEPVLFAGDADDNLIKVPFGAGRGQTAADLVGKTLAKLQRPLPHLLVADQDASCCEHVLHHPEAEPKSKVQPDSMADDLSREAMAGIARMVRRFHPSHIPQSCHPPVNLTVPLYMPALVAARFNPDPKAKYRALLAAGKPAKVTLTAIMRKLIILANALLRDQRNWSQNPLDQYGYSSCARSDW